MTKTIGSQNMLESYTQLTMKKIIIMGASSGLGLMLAEAFARNGVRVGLAARHTSVLHDLKKKYPGIIEYASIDITQPRASRQLEELAESLGGMDLYIHVAGIGVENPDLKPEKDSKIIETNATGFARMLASAYRIMRDNPHGGQIAAITSVAGTNGIGEMAAYSASKKFAQTYMTALEQLADREKTNICFTDIRPGWIRTPLLNDDKLYPLEMSQEYVLPLILKAICQKKRVAYIDARWGAVAMLWNMIPDRIWTKIHIPLTFDRKVADAPTPHEEHT